MSVVRTLALPLALVCVISACGTKPGTPDDLIAIEEAAVRHQISNNASGLRSNAKVYCIEMMKGDSRFDPTERLISRLATGQWRIRKRSACGINRESLVIEKESGVQGLILKVGIVEWTSDVEATIQVGYYEANESASGNVLHLKKVNGSWVVIKDELKWIS